MQKAGVGRLPYLQWPRGARVGLHRSPILRAGEAKSITTAILGLHPSLAGETYIPIGPKNGVRPGLGQRQLLLPRQSDRRQSPRPLQGLRCGPAAHHPALLAPPTPNPFFPLRIRGQPAKNSPLRIEHNFYTILSSQPATHAVCSTALYPGPPSSRRLGCLNNSPPRRPPSIVPHRRSFASGRPPALGAQRMGSPPPSVNVTSGLTLL